MIVSVGKAVYDANRIDRNRHLTNGRAWAAILIAFLWASWTFFYATLDYINIYLLNNYPVDEAVVIQIAIELLNLITTSLTAAHLLGYEFKWLKNDDKK